MNDYKPYTGIGSRDIDEDVFDLLVVVSMELTLKGYTLRSGGADGSDTAFEVPTNNKEIYLPWAKFNNNDSQLIMPDKHPAYEIAKNNHPVWDRLGPATKKLMARNVLQVLGNNLDSPSQFVVCYTKDGCESHVTRTSKTGGTGLAISVASKRNIPIFNLKNQTSIDLLVLNTGINL
jgi:hypothetical protein